MDMFWLTPANIKELYGSSFKSVDNFGLVHFIELALLIAACIVVTNIYKKKDEKGKNKILVILTILLWIDEIFKYAFTIATDQWIWNYLPLHLCSINLFVCAAYTITKSDKIRDVFYCLCIPGALIALIISPWFSAPVLNAMHLHSYTIHCLLIIYSVVALNGYTPNYKNLKYIAVVGIIVLIPIYFINIWLNTNFFYIHIPEEIIVTKFMYDLIGEYYFVLFAPLLLILWFLMYFPIVLATKKKNV